MTATPRTPASGVNVIGMLSSGTGIGAAGRATLQMLGAREIAHVAVDIDIGTYAVKEPIPASSRRFPRLSGLPYDVNVIQLNPDMFDVTLMHWYRQVGFDMLPTLNAIVPFWELPYLPAGWLPILRSMDVVLAPTEFIRDAVLNSMPEDPLRPLVLDYPQAICPPCDVTPDRARWFGSRADRTVFFSTFDIRSDIERKNPWAAVDAFQSAFADRQDVLLLIKVNNADSASHAEQYARLRGLALDDSRIHLMVEPLSRDDLWSLHASADIFISLHRSEGLGLGLMESMAVGTPVVATGWSGNVDFMDASNSIPVPYKLIPLRGVTHPLYAAEGCQQWADPDVGAAADAMRSLADSPTALASLGADAQASIARRWAAQCRFGVFDEVLRLSATGLASSDLHRSRVDAAERRAREQRLEPSYLWDSAKRGGVRVLRRAGLVPPAPAGEYPWGPPTVISDASVAS